MTDRELLELAAKAAEYQYSWSEKYDCLEIWADGDTTKRFWQPHRDDGDALRLAVALRFTVKIEDHEVEVFNWEGCIVSIGMFAGDDYNAATRRAIVRAAAEVGRNME